MDAPGGSRWNFRGCAVDGSLKGSCLDEVNVLKTTGLIGATIIRTPPSAVSGRESIKRGSKTEICQPSCQSSRPRDGTVCSNFLLAGNAGGMGRNFVPCLASMKK